jgi:hypothetical protein
MADTPIAGKQEVETIDSKEFAKRRGLPLTWVQNHTRRHCSDPIPHVKLGHLVRFEWGSDELEQWWDKHRKHGAGGTAAQDTEEASVPEARKLARGVLPGSAGRERGARLAADILKPRAA